MKFTNLLRTLTAFVLILIIQGLAIGQGVTTSAMAGRVKDADTGEGLIGANVLAVHLPSGTSYGNSTDLDGFFRIPGMRVGGPYKVTVTYTGFQEKTIENIYLSLGATASVDVLLTETAVELTGVEIVAGRGDLFSNDRTGAGTNINSETLRAFPTLNRTFDDFTRLTPQANGSSFGGQDNRLNNITLDGSIFNNSFGLAGAPGARTGVSPISLDAIEEIQVNIAPYDVRQGGFVGAGINAVTRSGTNDFSGSVYYFVRNQNLVGENARERTVSVTDFNTAQYGARIGGPIIKNKLFFFVNAEIDARSEPFQLRANRGETPGGNITSVAEADLVGFSNFLRNNLGYETGPFEGYDLETDATKISARLDYNLNRNNKINVRYTMLESSRDVLVSTSSSLGFGNRRGSNSLSYQNSNYIQNENISSIIGEWNSILSSRMSNNMVIGYTYQNEDRGSRGDFFPLTEIQNNGQTYLTAGFEPFTPFNQLSYKTLQFQNNFSYYSGKHTITAGLNLERLTFRNVFFPGSQGVFVYNNLEDFYTDANGFLDNPGRDTSTVTLRRFQYRYSALPGGAEPVQPTEVTYGGLYLQDEFQATDRLNITLGIRADMPVFGETGFENETVSKQTYRLDGENIQVSTSKLPDPQLLISPRLGFNFDAMGDQSLQIRGGTGLFAGRPVFVWISNQIGNNGVLTGFEQIDNTRTRPFTTNPGQFITNPAAPATFELALTDPNFKFLQVWRSSLAADAKLPGGIIGTLEFVYSKNINGYLYKNVNEEEATGAFPGPDNRDRFPGSGLSGGALNSAIRINDNTVNAMYLTNTNEGYAYTFTAQLQKRFDFGLSANVAYNYGQAKDLMNAGSIAAGSYNGVQSVNGNNNLELAFSSNEQRHRLMGGLSYRAEYLKFGATQISLFFEAGNQGRYSYTYNQDMNGDGVNGNDLIFVPNNASDLTFLPLTSGGVTYTPEQQEAAFEQFIESDPYLQTRRGQHAERNGSLLPWLARADLSFIQELFTDLGGKRNTLQFRVDIQNFTNLISKDWGVSQSVINTRPLTYAGLTAEGVPQFRMATFGGDLLRQPTQYNAFLTDVWQLQFGLRYIFN
jgi:hypothetical protein